MQYDTLNKLGIKLDRASGHISYSKVFIPPRLNFNLMLIRHGETYGNCGQCDAHAKIDQYLVKSGKKNKEHRIFQGNVDSEINQLTHLGKTQALNAAIEIENTLLAEGWLPDIIYHSPLTRAKETGLPYVLRNHFSDRYVVHDGIKEMSFGAWDNRRICDLSSSDPCHLFYLDQNALVKSSGINGDGIYQTAENFCEVIIRAYEVLLQIEKDHAGKNVMFFSHSMFGAACCIVLGHGQKIESGNYLAFDGKRKDGTSYILPFATPLYINKCINQQV